MFFYKTCILLCTCVQRKWDVGVDIITLPNLKSSFIKNWIIIFGIRNFFPTSAKNTIFFIKHSSNNILTSSALQNGAHIVLPIIPGTRTGAGRVDGIVDMLKYGTGLGFREQDGPGRSRFSTTAGLSTRFHIDFLHFVCSSIIFTFWRVAPNLNTSSIFQDLFRHLRKWAPGRSWLE
jgi:hypothetical protein